MPLATKNCLILSVKCFKRLLERAQWLSGRALDSRPKGRGFKPHRHHWVVSVSKNINPSLVLVQPRKTYHFITERLLMGRKESNQTNKQIKGSWSISVDPDQTAPVGAVLSGSILFPSTLTLVSKVKQIYDQQMTRADSDFRCFFAGPFRVKTLERFVCGSLFCGSLYVM